MNTKEKIIDSSLKLFLLRGYDGFSMRDASKEAGIKQPSLYYFFDDKLVLFKECVHYFFDKWYSVLPDYFSENTGIQQLVKNTCLSLGMDREIISKLYGIETDIGQYRIILDIIKYCPECFDRMNKFNEEFYNLLYMLTDQAKKQGTIRNNVSAESIYIMLSSLTEGSNLLRITDPDLNIENYSKEIYENIWNGIKNLEEKK